jgi:hypothetical protein
MTMSEEGKKLHISGRVEKKDSFAYILRAARKSRGFCQWRAGRAVSKSARSIKNWESGRFTPSEVVQAAILREIRGSKESPSFHYLRKAGRTHHIAWEKGRGWFMRVTIQVGKKVVGRRIKVRLKTRDIDEAVRTRDVVLSSYKVMGFSVANVTTSKGTSPKNRQIDTP